MTFRNVLAFENFVLLIVVIFGLQFVDRSFGPILPLYVAQLGTPVRRCRSCPACCFRSPREPARSATICCGALLRNASARVVIAGAGATAAAGTLVYVFANGAGLLVVGAALFGVAIGVATTAAYTAASTIIPASARGTGFGLLATGSLTGLAISPIVSGLLGAISIRAVFLLDTICLVVLAGMVRRLMVTAPLTATPAPTTEEL